MISKDAVRLTSSVQKRNNFAYKTPNSLYLFLVKKLKTRKLKTHLDTFGT